MVGVLGVNPRSEEFTQDGELLATWWRQASPGCFYWRNLIPARHLPGQVLYLTTSDLQPHDTFDVHVPRQVGAAVWPFSGNATRGAIMASMQEHGIRVLLEADDNYLIPSPTLGPDWQIGFDRTGQDKHSLQAHARIAQWVNGIIVSTPKLRDIYRQLNRSVYLCENQVDPDDWPEPEKLGDGILRIGYAGSHSHIVDLPLIRRGLAKAAEMPGTEVWVYGLGDICKFPGHVRKVPWTDNLADYRRSLQKLDVGLCPLVENPWSICKSAIKAYEYALAGTLPIVQDSIVYDSYQGPSIRCRTTKDWQAALKWCALNPDEVRSLAREARAYVIAKHDIRNHMDAWKEAILG